MLANGHLFKFSSFYFACCYARVKRICSFVREHEFAWRHFRAERKALDIVST